MSTSTEPVEEDSESNEKINAKESPDVVVSTFEDSFIGNGEQATTDWSRSYHGLSSQAFAKDIADVLLAPVDPMDIEIKPGLCFGGACLPDLSMPQTVSFTFPKSSIDVFSTKPSVLERGGSHLEVRRMWVRG
jgi:Mitochondrial genome maintenance MGM101